MTDEARKARAAYHKEWARKNPEKVRAAAEKYWEKKAAEAAKAQKARAEA